MTSPRKESTRKEAAEKAVKPRRLKETAQKGPAETAMRPPAGKKMRDK